PGKTRQLEQQAAMRRREGFAGFGEGGAAAVEAGDEHERGSFSFFGYVNVGGGAAGPQGGGHHAGGGDRVQDVTHIGSPRRSDWGTDHFPFAPRMAIGLCADCWGGHGAAPGFYG